MLRSYPGRRGVVNHRAGESGGGAFVKLRRIPCLPLTYFQRRVVGGRVALVHGDGRRVGRLDVDADGGRGRGQQAVAGRIGEAVGADVAGIGNGRHLSPWLVWPSLVG